MQNITKTIKDQLHKALEVLKVEAPTEIHLEHPANPQHGDWSTNIAMVLFGQKQSPSEYSQPRQFAQAIVDVLKRDVQENSLFTRIDVAGPGFINFSVADSVFIDHALEVTQDLKKTILQSGNNRKVVVEYSSPNIAKPFTIGHLRSTIIGDAVANLLEFTGWKIYRDNHLGDWGTQFGKQIYAIKAWGNEEEIEKSDQPVKDLVNLYIKFHEEAEKNPELEEEGRKWFKKLEDGDQEARRIWQKCIDWSLKEFHKIYQILDIHFTENQGKGYGESFFEDKMGDVIDELKQKSLLKESEGAQLVFFPEEKYPPLMIMKKDGATLYATRDLATDKFRLQHYGQDIVVINEVGIEQSLYWQQIFETEKLLGWYKPDQRVHIKHGHFRFQDKKMSTRKGNVIWLEDVLNEAEKRAAALAQQKGSGEENQSRAIGVGALKWNDLKRSSTLDVIFDWDEMLSLQGNSGPYMQYTFARCQSVLTKASDQNQKIDSSNNFMSYTTNDEEKAVLRLLSRFNEVVQQAAADYSPHHLSTYLFELAQSFNLFYNRHSILGKENGDREVVAFRLLLTKATSMVIGQGLQLLGIQPLQKM